jgi:hypothetical protein
MVSCDKNRMIPNISQEASFCCMTVRYTSRESRTDQAEQAMQAATTGGRTDYGFRTCREGWRRAWHISIAYASQNFVKLLTGLLPPSYSHGSNVFCTSLWTKMLTRVHGKTCFSSIAIVWSWVAPARLNEMSKGKVVCIPLSFFGD